MAYRHSSRFLHVAGNLTLESGERRELPVIAEALEHVNLKMKPAKLVLRASEKVHLAAEVLAAKGWTSADVQQAVSATTGEERVYEVDARLRSQHAAVQAEVRRRIPEGRTDPIPRFDTPEDQVRSTEKAGSVLNASFGHEIADPRAADNVSVCKVGGDDDKLEAESSAQLGQRIGGSGTILPESESFAYNERTHPQRLKKDLRDELPWRHPSDEIE